MAQSSALPTPKDAPDGMDDYRPWFFAAALYNAVWGGSVMLMPGWIFEALRLPPPDALPYWQVVGMMVLVFAPAYWWASRDPWRHRPLVLIGSAGKLLGALGFVVAASAGQLPWVFGLVVLTNDVLWLPVFGRFSWQVVRWTGWRQVLAGR